jgi:hypothetical protein
MTANPAPSGGVDPTTIGMFVCLVTFLVLAIVITAALGGVSKASSFELADNQRGLATTSQGGRHSA